MNTRTFKRLVTRKIASYSPSYNEEDGETVSIIRNLENIDGEILSDLSTIKINLEKIKENLLEEGDIVFKGVISQRDTNSKIFLVDENNKNHLVSKKYISFKVNKSLINPTFLYHQLNFLFSKNMLENCYVSKTGGSNKQILVKELLKYNIVCPPLTIQKELVDKISLIKFLIRKKYGQIKKMMLIEKELFSHHPKSLKNNTFTKMGEYVDVYTLTGKAKIKADPNCSEGYVLLRPKNIKNDVLDLSVVDRDSRTNYLRKFKMAILKQNDIVMVTEGYIGNCAIIDQNYKYFLDTSLAMLRTKNNDLLDYKFLYYYLANNKDYIKTFAKIGTHKTFLNTTIIKSIPIVLPNIDEQRKIVLIMDNICSIKTKIISQIKLLESIIEKQIEDKLFCAFGKVNIK